LGSSMKLLVPPPEEGDSYPAAGWADHPRFLTCRRRPGKRSAADRSAARGPASADTWISTGGRRHWRAGYAVLPAPIFAAQLRFNNSSACMASAGRKSIHFRRRTLSAHTGIHRSRQGLHLGASYGGDAVARRRDVRVGRVSLRGVGRGIRGFASVFENGQSPNEARGPALGTGSLGTATRRRR